MYREEAIPGPLLEARRYPPEWRPLERWFGTALVVLLLGYAFFGRGFAYLHISAGPTVYVGELVLALGLLAVVLRSRMLGRALRSGPARMYLLFALWGAVRTVPNLGTYGMDAVRDSVIYYYGLFMLLVPELVTDRRQLQRIAYLYGRVAGVYVFWVLIEDLAVTFLGGRLPTVPGTGVRLLYLRAGDSTVHVACAMAFFMLVAGHVPGERLKEKGVGWYVVALLSGIASLGRAAYLALASALSVAFALGRRERLWRPLLGIALLAAAFLLVNPRVNWGGREISPEWMLGYTRGIFVRTEEPEFKQSTKEWRLNLWSDMVDDLSVRSSLLQGRGCGPNIVAELGYEREDRARPNRNPHSCHMTVLSRMGIVGFLIWVLLQGSLVFYLYKRWRRAGDAGDRFLQGVLAWVLCYWIAFMMDASFSVSLEGPHQGIWFWSILGLGLAAAQLEPRSEKKAETRA